MILDCELWMFQPIIEDIGLLDLQLLILLPDRPVHLFYNVTRSELLVLQERVRRRLRPAEDWCLRRVWCVWRVREEITILRASCRCIRRNALFAERWKTWRRSYRLLLRTIVVMWKPRSRRDQRYLVLLHCRYLCKLLLQKNAFRNKYLDLNFAPLMFCNNQNLN